MPLNNLTIDHDRTRLITRILVISVLSASFLAIGAIAMRQLPGAATKAEASGFSTVERAQADSIQQFADGMVPYADDDPYSGPSVSGWLSVKPSATSLAPEYDTKHRRVPVHSDSGAVIGYDYTYIGFVPLDLADSPSFDEHAVRAEALGGCDPFPIDDTQGSCDLRNWVKPHAK